MTANLKHSGVNAVALKLKAVLSPIVRKDFGRCYFVVV